MDQIKIHDEIEKIINDSVKNAEAFKVREIIQINADARNFFFEKIDDSWFDWLRDNGFLEPIKQKARASSQHRYLMPELEYLERMTKQIPHKVVDFMLLVPISEESFNPEVIARFIWICSRLPAIEIARMIPKMLNEEWVRLMKNFLPESFDFGAMLKTLSEAKDMASIVALADVMLLIRKKEDLDDVSSYRKNPFYLNNIVYTDVFPKLSSVDDEFIEGALKVASRVFGGIVLLGEKDNDGIFNIADTYALYDVDFFKVKIGEDRYDLLGEHDLAATVAKLGRRIFSGADAKEAQRLFDAYIKCLPDARVVWRLKLFIWSLNSEVFKEDLRSAFFRLFEHSDNSFLIAGGAEYERALKSAFDVLPEKERRKYIENIYEFFPRTEDSNFGGSLFEQIYNYLDDEEKKRAEVTYGPLHPERQPRSSIGEVRGGTVIPQPPSDSEMLWSGPIAELVEVFKTTWSPEKIIESSPERDFLRPVNAEGVGDRMKVEIKNRFGDYVSDARLFFDREKLDAHYTYDYLQGIHEVIRADHTVAEVIDWHPFFGLANDVIASGSLESFSREPRERDRYGWLANWTAVHSALADVLKDLLENHDKKSIVDFTTYRENALGILKYLFTYPDPIPDDEELATAKSKMKAPGMEDYQVSDPFAMAINSVRGRAFEAFLQFVYLDGLTFAEKAEVKLKEDVKSLYEQILSHEETRAIMFMFGRFLAFFYFRDRKWIERLLPRILPKEKLMNGKYLAAWEGYLSSALYEELFELLKVQYLMAIQQPPIEDPSRRHAVDSEEALATHIALAYIHFSNFKLESDVLQKFWSQSSVERKGYFISFIGRHIESRPREEVDTTKLQSLWDWILKNCDETQALEKFEFWIMTKFFEVHWLAERVRMTLEKTQGKMDWEVFLGKSLVDFVDKTPEISLDILRLYLINGQKEGGEYYRALHYTTENLKELLRKLYTNPVTRGKTYQLIDDLLPLGNGRFWDLKEIIDSGIS